MKVHPCTGAGRWFPADAGRLAKLVDGYVGVAATVIPRPPVALVVPHAGYAFSGPVAGKAYATLRGRAYRRVILLGPSHRAPVRGASVLRVDAYDTPLGRILVDTDARDALLKCPVVAEQRGAHLAEHSVENQLPMLQRVLKGFKMVEMLVGDLSDSNRAVLAEALRALLDDQTLLVVSSDFCHYGPNFGYVPFRDRVPERLQGLNDMALQELFQVDVPGWDRFLAETRDTICGRHSIGVMLKVLEPWDDVRAARVGYDTSGRITGDWTNSVTYAAVAFWRAGNGLTEAEQQTLLRLARDAVVHYLKTGQRFRPDATKYGLTPALKVPAAAFVTLKNKGRLRGCIGHVVAQEPLYLSVAENACRACRDPRFVPNPVTEKEVPELAVEISVLTPMRRLNDPEKVRVGTDGLMIMRDRRRGLLLPQVPGEQGWNREEFLAGACRKAGLPTDAWKDPQTELYRFSAQVFGEGHPAAKEP